MMNMKKRLAIILAAVMVLTCLFGCGASGKAQAGKTGVKILVSVSRMDTFRQMLAEAVQSKALEAGAQADLYDAEGSIENQVEHMKMALTGGYDVIICLPVNTDTVVELKASAGDIPIIFCNSCPEENQLQAGKYVYVGSSEQVAGEYQAEYVLDKFSGKDEINVAILTGEPGHSAAVGRTRGVKKALNDSGKQINYVFEDTGVWDTGKAKELMQILLKTGVPVDCVLCNNDSMALGVVEACKEAGIDLSAVPVLGVDATAEGCAAIEAGEMAFTVYQSGTGQGEAAIEYALRIANGQSVKDVEGITEDGLYVWVPFVKVDSTNVSSYK